MEWLKETLSGNVAAVSKILPQRSHAEQSKPQVYVTMMPAVERLDPVSIYQDVEERQGGSGSYQACQGSGGGEGHVLCKMASSQEFARSLVE